MTMVTQKNDLRAFFENRAGQWIPLPDILRLGIAQYNARIHELRREGMRIDNKTAKVGGTRNSWYMFVKER